MLYIVPPSHQGENEITNDQVAENFEEAIYERPLDPTVPVQNQNIEVEYRTANEYGYDQGDQVNETSMAEPFRLAETTMVESELSESSTDQDESVTDEYDDGDDEDSQLSHNNRPRKRRRQALTIQEERRRRRTSQQIRRARETIEEANRRRALNALRMANRRRRRTNEQRLRENAANAARNAEAIHNETPQQREDRLAAMRETTAEGRANETPQETADRLEIERIRQAENRANETPEEREQRQIADNERHRAVNNNLTDQQRAAINQQRQARGQLEGQDQPNTRAAYNWANMDDDRNALALNDVQDFNQECVFCHAIYSRDELNTRREYNRCCMRGKI